MAQADGHGALSILEFCKWAGIGRTLAYKEIECGKLRIKKVGRRTLITMDAARNWLDALPSGAG
ncbi:DNA-binding protein [Xanthobacter sp. V0B-10]|uniref:DNA-binding protein n=1 Tax=Xanthobacter TaxID=279 RepID=UPI001EDD76B8|nr:MULTISPECIES: DNA-binding protein [unclassified Xanthobacter]